MDVLDRVNIEKCKLAELQVLELRATVMISEMAGVNSPQ